MKDLAKHILFCIFPPNNIHNNKTCIKNNNSFISYIIKPYVRLISYITPKNFYVIDNDLDFFSKTQEQINKELTEKNKKLNKQNKEKTKPYKDK